MHGGRKKMAVERAKAIYVFANEKGGMAACNTEKINEIILELSSESAYTAKQLKSDGRVDETVAAMRDKLARTGVEGRRAAAALVKKQVAQLEASRRFDRVCAVVDFDMFYAAVEIRDRPELAEKPVAVGGLGMISTANYVARRWGVRRCSTVIRTRDLPICLNRTSLACLRGWGVIGADAAGGR